MTSLFVIESPFQLLSAIEAKQKFHILDAMLIVRYTLDTQTNLQIDRLLKISPWEKVIEIKSIFSIFDSNLKLSIQLFKLKNIKFDNIFIGEYRSWVLRSFLYNLDANNYYLLDDGAASLTVYNQYVKEKRQPVLQPSKLDTILLGLYKLMGLHTHGSVNLLFFTSFDIYTENCVKNDFSYIKKRMSEQTILQNTTYFFGAPLSEGNIISESHELAYIQEIINYHAAIGRDLVYVPHRRESAQKKEKIRALNNIAMSTFEFPAEIEFIFRKELPDTIASFYSTVLQTLPKIYSFREVTAFEIPLQTIAKKSQQSIDFVYNEYRKSITIIPLESH